MIQIDYIGNWIQKPNIDEYSNCFVGRGDYYGHKHDELCFFVNFNNNNPVKYSFNEYVHERSNDEEIARKLDLL